VTEPADPTNPDVALNLLLDGNQRWASERLEHPNQSVGRRVEVAPRQDPFALVFSCIDSRVPPEVIFDRGAGDLFVVRTGAQTLNEQTVLGSIEFGPAEFDSCRLIVVLGHQRCGAVTAAIKSIESGVPASGHIQSVVAALRPAYDEASGELGDLVENMVRAQVRLTVATLKADPLLASLVAEKGLVIIGARYDLDSGAVDIIA
jgi:carbonic anhydrase